MSRDLPDLAAILDRLAGTPVTVCGDAIVDEYASGSATGLCREGPVPVVRIGERVRAAGGAANVAASVAAVGGRPRLVTVVGDDEAGRWLRDRHHSAADTVLVEPGRPTPVKRRVLADGQLVVRIDDGGEPAPAPATVRRAAAAAVVAALDSSALVVSDYGYGTVAEPVLDALVRARPQLPGPLVVDAKDPGRFRRLRPTVATPNYAEAVRLLGLPPVADAERAGQLEERAADLLAATGAGRVAVTLDRAGVLLLEPGRPPFRSVWPGRRGSGRAGAGDAFAAVLALALAAGADPAAAVELAAAGGAVAVERPGTAVCDRTELLRRLSPAGTVLDPAELAGLGERCRRRGDRVVFTNGCFDLLHGGHLSSLSRAKAAGDVLVVGVNDDDSVRRLKGSGRPVLPLAERMRLLAALSFVDCVVPFGGDRPVDLIAALRPDVYAKGADYSLETLPEAELVRRQGGEVRFLELVEDRSTTGLIDRIQAAVAAGP